MYTCSLVNFCRRQKEFANIDSIIFNLRTACNIQNTQFPLNLLGVGFQFHTLNYLRLR